MKVAVGSQTGVARLQGLLCREAVERHCHNQKWNKSTRARFTLRLQQVATRAFEIVHHNVSMGGADWDPDLQEDDMEPRDRTLLGNLKARQLAVAELIEQVTAHRRASAARLATARAQSLARRREAIAARQFVLASEAPPTPAAATPAEGEPAAAAGGVLPAVTTERVTRAMQGIADLTKGKQKLAGLVGDYRELLGALQTAVSTLDAEQAEAAAP